MLDKNQNPRKTDAVIGEGDEREEAGHRFAHLVGHGGRGVATGDRLFLGARLAALDPFRALEAL